MTINDTLDQTSFDGCNYTNVKAFILRHNRLAYLLALVVFENWSWLEWKQSINLVDLEFKSNESLEDLEFDKISSEIRLTSLY